VGCCDEHAVHVLLCENESMYAMYDHTTDAITSIRGQDDKENGKVGMGIHDNELYEKCKSFRGWICRYSS